jgi:hypothetical protein
MFETVILIPLFSMTQGYNAYALSNVSAFANSRLIFLDNSLRLTGRGTKSPVMFTVVPR